MEQNQEETLKGEALLLVLMQEKVQVEGTGRA